MKKRIGTLKGKPIVEGGGSNIIKKNEISINDIGSSDSNDDDISYFGINVDVDVNFYGILQIIFPLKKIAHFVRNPVNVSINGNMGTYDSSALYEFGGNINDKSIYNEGIWYSIKEYLLKLGVHIEIFKPISKEEFYRTNYTKEEAEKIAEDYYNYALQFAPSETK